MGECGLDCETRNINLANRNTMPNAIRNNKNAHQNDRELKQNG